VAPTEQHEAASIEGVCVVTKDRAAAPHRVLESIARSLADHGRNEEVVVFGDPVVVQFKFWTIVLER
jgi:hypothetical protein